MPRKFPAPRAEHAFVKPGPGNCPKCHGFVALQGHFYGSCLSCINCGWARDVGGRNRNPMFIAREETRKAA